MLAFWWTCSFFSVACQSSNFEQKKNEAVTWKKRWYIKSKTHDLYFLKKLLNQRERKIIQNFGFWHWRGVPNKTWGEKFRLPRTHNFVVTSSSSSSFAYQVVNHIYLMRCVCECEIKQKWDVNLFLYFLFRLCSYKMLQDVEEITLMDGCQAMKYSSFNSLTRSLARSREVNIVISFNHFASQCVWHHQNYNYSSYGDTLN